MIQFSREETAAIVSGRANAFSRVFFDNGKPSGSPPWKIGEKLLFGHVPDGDRGMAVVFAEVTVMSLRCDDSETRRRGEASEAMAKNEGYGSVEAWCHAFDIKYGRSLRAKVWRTQFRLERVIEK